MTTVYVINLSPSYALEGDTPQRVWLRKDVSYDNGEVKDTRSHSQVH